MAMELTSTAFSPGGEIPRKHTCQGKDISPPLAWSGVPANAKSLVLIVEDPDAPDPAAPKETWVHWVVYNIPPQAGMLPESAKYLPAGTREGENDGGRLGHTGPCPPVGRHRYVHRLYALDAVLPDLGPAPSRAKVEAAMRAHVIAQAELIGTYQKLARRARRSSG